MNADERKPYQKPARQQGLVSQGRPSLTVGLLTRPRSSASNFSVTLSRFGFISENKLHLRKQIEQQFARIDVHIVGRAKLAEVRRTISIRRRVNIPKPAPRLQSRGAEGQCDVVNQQWSIGDSETQVPANLMSNARLKQDVFKGFRAMKPQIVDVEYRFYSLRDFRINAAVVDEDTGIDKVCLSFNLAAA